MNMNDEVVGATDSPIQAFADDHVPPSRLSDSGHPLTASEAHIRTSDSELHISTAGDLLAHPSVKRVHSCTRESSSMYAMGRSVSRPAYSVEGLSREARSLFLRVRSFRSFRSFSSILGLIDTWNVTPASCCRHDPTVHSALRTGHSLKRSAL